MPQASAGQRSSMPWHDGTIGKSWKKGSWGGGWGAPRRGAVTVVGVEDRPVFQGPVRIVILEYGVHVAC